MMLRHWELTPHWSNVTSQKNGILNHTAVIMREFVSFIVFGDPADITLIKIAYAIFRLTYLTHFTSI
jgi:hypothetical protein